jgi:hypothetical protein
VAALLSRQRDVIVADQESRARLLDTLAWFVRAGSGSARGTLLGLDDLLLLHGSSARTRAGWSIMFPLSSPPRVMFATLTNDESPDSTL